MKIRRKSSQSSFFVNPSRTIKSAVESLESSYFPVRRFGSGSFGKISPTFMKSWCSCQNNSNGLQRSLVSCRCGFRSSFLSGRTERCCENPAYDTPLTPQCNLQFVSNWLLIFNIIIELLKSNFGQFDIRIYVYQFFGN
jgi:hypothetical protein